MVTKTKFKGKKRMAIHPYEAYVVRKMRAGNDASSLKQVMCLNTNRGNLEYVAKHNLRTCSRENVQNDSVYCKLEQMFRELAEDYDGNISSIRSKGNKKEGEKIIKASKSTLHEIGLKYLELREQLYFRTMKEPIYESLLNCSIDSLKNRFINQFGGKWFYKGIV